MNDVLKQVCILLNVTHKSSTAFHHETIGSLERNHRVLNVFLRTHHENKDAKWNELLPFYCLAYNSTPLSVNNCTYSPYELVYGKLPQLPNVEIPSTPFYSDLETYNHDLRSRLLHAHRMMHDYLRNFKIKQTSALNKGRKPQVFKPGDLVKLYVSKNVINCHQCMLVHIPLQKLMVLIRKS